jgi:hypothetical protein
MERSNELVELIDNLSRQIEALFNLVGALQILLTSKGICTEDDFIAASEQAWDKPSVKATCKDCGKPIYYGKGHK